jgi:hypothetical protein
MFARLRELFRPRPARRALRRPTLESLEDRTAPATVTGVTPTFDFTGGAFGAGGFGSTAAGFGLGNPGFGLGGAPTTSLSTFGLGLGVPGFGTTTLTATGLGLGTTGFGTGTAGFGVGPLGLGSTSSLGVGSTTFGATPVGFGLASTGFGLAAPANLFTQGPNLSSFGLGLGTPAFAAGMSALGLNAPSFTAFGTPLFGLNTPGIELNTFGLGLGNSALGTNPTNFGITGSLPLGFTGGTSLDASLLTAFAQVTQQAIALEQQAAQQAVNAALAAFGAGLLTNDTSLLAGVQPILQQLGVTLPPFNAQAALNAQVITLLNANPTANQFAAASINQQIQDAQLLQAEVTAGANLNAINFAVASLPTVGSDLLTALQFQQSQLQHV